MPGRPPFFPQERDYSCVPACLRMVLAYHGLNLTEDDLIYACNCDKGGAYADDAVEAAKRLGFERTSKDRPTIEGLIAMLQLGEFAIVWIARGSIRHTVVPIGVVGDSIEILDPAHQQGILTVPLNTFLEEWDRQGRLAVVVRR
jgi:ABC-type bacteriocin/lantibiotic exporter with double-glycine peptidase domain